MKLPLSEYVFNIGDEVITIEGERGHITRICDCKHCKERGFFEPCWIDEDGDPRDISVYEAEGGFRSYYSIGQYRFNPFAKDSVQEQIDSVEAWLAQLKNRLNRIKVLEETVLIGPVPMAKILSVWQLLPANTRFTFHGEGLFSFKVPSDNPLVSIDWDTVENYFATHKRHASVGEQHLIEFLKEEPDANKE